MASVADSFTSGTAITSLVGTISASGGQCTSVTNNSFVIGQYQGVSLGADQFAEMTITTLDAATSRRWGVATRLGVGGENYQLYLDASGGGTWALSKYHSFTYTAVSGVQSITVSLPMRIRLESVGSTQRAIINGIVVGTYTDTTIATGTYVGIYGNDPNSLVFGDDFYGGDMTPPPPVPISRAAVTRASTF